MYFRAHCFWLCDSDTVALVTDILWSNTGRSTFSLVSGIKKISLYMLSRSLSLALCSNVCVCAWHSHVTTFTFASIFLGFRLHFSRRLFHIFPFIHVRFLELTFWTTFILASHLDSHFDSHQVIARQFYTLCKYNSLCISLCYLTSFVTFISDTWTICSIDDFVSIWECFVYSIPFTRFHSFRFTPFRLLDLIFKAFRWIAIT